MATLSVAAFAVISLLVYLVWSGYRDAIQNAESTTRNYAAIIEARLDATLRRTDADLQELAGKIPVAALDLKTVPGYKSEIAAALKARLINFPELESLRIVDSNGDVIYFSDDNAFPPTNISDRDHFRKVRDGLPNRLVFSGVVISRITGRPSIFVVRAIPGRQGAFSGAILAGISLNYFQKLFQSFDIGAHGTISWRRTDDHRLVLRWPQRDPAVNQRLNPQNPIAQQLSAGARVTTQQFKSEIDGITRIYSTKALEIYPFHVNVGFGRDDILANWRVHSMTVCGFALFLLAVLAALLYRLWRAENAL
jgi:hypothetical protein